MNFVASPQERVTFSRKIGLGFEKGYHMAGEGWMLNLPFIALEVGTAGRGEMVPTVAGRTAGMLMQPVAAGLMSSALVATLGLPPAAAAIAAVIAVGAGSNYIENKLIRGIRTLTAGGANAMRLSFGQNFKDNPTARAMRMRAVQEMNYTLTPARRWLGQEARILHR